MLREEGARIRPAVIAFLDQIRNVEDVASLEAAFSKALWDLGFREWAYQVIRTDALPDEKPLILTTFSDAWYNHYIDSGYHRVDPVILNGPNQVAPFTWSAMSFGVEPSPEQRRLFAEAAEFGVGEGVGIPIHGARGALAMTSMVSDHGMEGLDRLMSTVGQDVHLLSLAFHNHARELLALGRMGRTTVSLTPRERECLLWTAAGKSAWQTAQILGISYRTVYFHLANVRSKMGVVNVYHAVMKAIMEGIISP